MHSVPCDWEIVWFTDCFDKNCSAATDLYTQNNAYPVRRLVFVLLQASMAVRIPLTALMHLHSLSA